MKGQRRFLPPFAFHADRHNHDHIINASRGKIWRIWYCFVQNPEQVWKQFLNDRAPEISCKQGIDKGLTAQQ